MRMRRIPIQKTQTLNCMYTSTHTEAHRLSVVEDRPTYLMAEQVMHVQHYTSKHVFRAPFEDKDSPCQTYTVNCSKLHDLQLFSPIPFSFSFDEFIKCESKQ